MEHDREGQGAGRTGFGGTTGGELGSTRNDDLNRTDDVGTRTGFGGVDDVGTRSGFGRAEDVVTRSSFSDSVDVGARAGFDSVDEDAGTRAGFDSVDEDAGTRAGSFDRKFVGESEAGEGQGRVQNALNSGKNRIADQLHRVGERIEERARQLDDSGGVQRRAGQFVHRAGGALDSGANYLREHEIDEMRDDLEAAIRERPLLSVGIALGAGFLLARMLRD